jgi:kynurenine formamidase
MNRALAGWIVAALTIGVSSVHWLSAQEASESGIAGWKQGIGWGWIWGPDDEVGALNAITPDSIMKALSLAQQGKIYDLGVAYDRTSYKWPGHSPGEIITFRSPEGVKRQNDLPAISNSPAGTAWHSCALFMNDNVATQIDGLGHVVAGDDNHWYNGFKESDWGGDWGVRKCDGDSIPPVVARGVLIDVAGYKGLDALPSNYSITSEDVQETLKWSGASLKPGDVVLVRTGTLRYWDETGSNHKKIKEHDTAGMSLEATKWLIEQNGTMMVGSDTSGYESMPPPEGSDSFIPVHDYLLVEQGVHIAEFHYLEDLARDKVYEFCYIAMVNKIKGTTAGFAMRPIGIK